MTKFTVVMPIRNEEQLLPYSLNSVYDIHPSKTILIFDRCVDNSVKVAQSISQRRKVSPQILLVEEKRKGWRWQLSYLLHYGVSLATNEIVFVANADVKMDARVKLKLGLLERERVGWVSFGYVDYPFSCSNMMERLIQRVHTLNVPTGTNYAFKKSVYQQISVEKLKNIHVGVDRLIFEEIKRRRFQVLFFPSKSLHLRPRGSTRHFLQGFLKCKRRENLGRVLVKSAVYVKPLMLAGFLKEMLQ